MGAYRQIYLDSLRGIAALIVICCHYVAAYYPYALFGLQGEYKQHYALERIFFYPPFGLIVAGHFAVCLFFILSGYVLSYQYIGQGNNTFKLIGAILKRPIRLGGLVWFSIIISFIFLQFSLFKNDAVAGLTSSIPWFSQFWNIEPTFSSFFGTLLISPFSKGATYNPPLWTIKIELYGSMMVYLFLLFFRRNKFRSIIVFILIVLFKNSLYQGFWIGVLLAQMNKNYLIQEHSNFKINITLTILFFYFSSYPSYCTDQFLAKAGTPYSYLPSDVGFGGGYCMLSAVLVFYTTLVSSKLKKYLCHDIFQFFGKISYSLYALHFLILGSFSSWFFLLFQKFFGYNTFFVINLLTSFLLIILTAFLTTKYVERPSLKFAQFTSDVLVKTIIQPLGVKLRGRVI